MWSKHRILCEGDSYFQAYRLIKTSNLITYKLININEIKEKEKEEEEKKRWENECEIESDRNSKLKQQIKWVPLGHWLYLLFLACVSAVVFSLYVSLVFLFSTSSLVETWAHMNSLERWINILIAIISLLIKLYSLFFVFYFSFRKYRFQITRLVSTGLLTRSSPPELMLINLFSYFPNIDYSHIYLWIKLFELLVCVAHNDAFFYL